MQHETSKIVQELMEELCAPDQVYLDRRMDTQTADTNTREIATTDRATEVATGTNTGAVAHHHLTRDEEELHIEIEMTRVTGPRGIAAAGVIAVALVPGMDSRNSVKRVARS